MMDAQLRRHILEGQQGRARGIDRRLLHLKQKSLRESRRRTRQAIERDAKEPLVDRVQANLESLVEVAAGFGEVAHAVVARAHFAIGGELLVDIQVAQQGLAIVGNSRSEIAAAGERVAHQVERGAFILAVGHGVVDHLVEQLDGAVEPE